MKLHGAHFDVCRSALNGVLVLIIATYIQSNITTTGSYINIRISLRYRVRLFA